MDKQLIIDALPILGILGALAATFFVGKTAGKEDANADFAERVKEIWRKPYLARATRLERKPPPPLPVVPPDQVPTDSQLDALHERVKKLEDK